MPDVQAIEPANNPTLEKVVVLLAALLTKDDDNLVEKVKLLQPLGLSNAEIARATGSSESGVRGTLSRLKN